MLERALPMPTIGVPIACAALARFFQQTNAPGVPSNETNDAIRFAARTEAMITDPVYEGKSMQGMMDLVKKGYFPEGSKVLYAHLGGAPALNGYSYTYRNG